MADPDDGPPPVEGTEDMFAKLNRKTSALDRLQAETEDQLAELRRLQADKDAQIAKVQRRQVALERKLERWNHELAELMDELVRRLIATAERLMRLDAAIGEIAERHPESRPDLDTLRSELLSETHRLADHTGLMKQMAYRVHGLEPTGTPKQTTPLIPYDRALRHRLTDIFMLTLGVGGLLQIASLLPIAHPAADIAKDLGFALCAFGAGVGIAHDMLRRRIRTTPTRR